jgi:hypothetical protein
LVHMRIVLICRLLPKVWLPPNKGAYMFTHGPNQARP